MAVNASSAATTRDEEACFIIPPGQFGGFWMLERYSDARIRLVISQSQEQGSNDQDYTSPSVIYKEIPVHKVVLERGSTYFKGLLTTGNDIADPTSKEKTQHDSNRIKIEESSQFIDLHCDTEEVAAANEAVLEFMYNHKLPASPTVSMLHKMITIADYLGADICLQACADNLTQHKFDQQSVPELHDIIDKVESCPSLNSSLIRKLQAALSECILVMYCDALSIVTNNDLLLSFCELPLRSVKLWGSSDKLRVDSENTVVVLLDKWWHSQTEHIHTEDCKKTLSGLVRLAFLSSGYLHYALDSLDWFIPPFPQLKYACSLIKLHGVGKVDVSNKPFAMMVLTKRNDSWIRQLHLEWSIPFEGIQQAINKTGDGYIEGPKAYWKGHCWQVSFQPKASDKDDHYVKLCLNIKNQPAQSMPGNMPASAIVRVFGDPFTATWKQVIFNGFHEFLCGFHHVKGQDVATELEDYLDDNHLDVTVSITDVD